MYTTQVSLLLLPLLINFSPHRLSEKHITGCQRRVHLHPPYPPPPPPKSATVSLMHPQSCALLLLVPPTPSGHSTIIDYIISNSDAFRGISSCSTLEEHSLNTSDHLPISCSLNLTHIRVPPMPLFPSNDLDCSTAVKEHSVLLYSNASDDAVRPLLSKDYSSIDDLNQAYFQ